MLKLSIFVRLLAVFFIFHADSINAAFVAFESESGALGTDWAVSNSVSPAYITITSNGSGNNPGSTNRVASYTVTFPAAGTYQLYARLRIGAGGANDDSLFFASSFGAKSPTNNADWNLVNNISGNGFSNSTDIVTGGGSVGGGVWKWINLSQLLGQNGFIVSAGNLTQTFQIGARENGLDLDKFVFGLLNYTFTVSNLDNGTDGTPPPPPVCGVSWTNTQQRIDGFGFSSAWCGQLSAAKNNTLYYTLGMSILRIRIDENGAWSQETANAAAAHAAGVKVLGSPWSAPVAWTSNGSNSMGYLLPSHYGDYVNWLNSACTNIGLDYVSIQNEPDYSAWMNWSSAQMFNFMKTNASALVKPVVMAEAFQFNDNYSDPIINDPVAGTNFAIFGGHFYGGGNYVHANAIAHGKPVWMTEHYLDGGTTNFPVCLNWAKEINDAMKNQFNAYIAWWAQDGDTNINLANQSGTILKDGYTLGHFSKFIRPGFYRIGATNTIGGAEISAYKDAVSSNYVIVAINRTDMVITQQFNFTGFPVSAVTPWITSWTQSLAVQPAITNIGATFIYAIQPSNIVTFVGSVPPSTPTNFIAAPGKNKVDLNWGAVTGASNYNIKRATVSSGPYTTLTNVTATSFGDINTAFGTVYFYVVSAVNISGESANSAVASAQAMQYFSALPLADSYVESSTATSNWGTSTNLVVKNNVTLATRSAYLMFDVRSLTNLRSATITLVPNRVDDATVKMYYEVTSTNWTENGITWNNQPGGTGIYLMTNTLVVGVPVVLDVTSAAASQATNGGLLSLRISQPTNSLNGLIQFSSKEHPTNSWRPVLEYSYFTNSAPALASIANQVIGAGVTLNLANAASDGDVPTQTLTFSLLTAPTNAVINASSGALTWRPLVTQANTTNPFTVMVTDSGTPTLTVTQSFLVTVTNLSPPLILNPVVSASQFVLQVNGDSGPDYQIQTSTNLVNWSAVFTTNSPPLPFAWTNGNGSPMNFFRIVVGPPF